MPMIVSSAAADRQGTVERIERDDDGLLSGDGGSTYFEWREDWARK